LNLVFQLRLSEFNSQPSMRFISGLMTVRCQGIPHWSGW